MAYTPLPQLGNESPGYYALADASTQTTEEDFFLLEHTRDASTQTREEGFFFLEHTRDKTTQTTEEEFVFLSQIQSTRNCSLPILESTVDDTEAVSFENAVEIEAVNVNDEKIFLCKVCEKDLGGHSEERRNITWYYCCVCSYRSGKRASLQRHINIHRAHNKCDVCKREYTEGEPHLSENTCNVCKVEFDCKTFLDQHYVVHHKKHFLAHCWVCGNGMKYHLNTFDIRTFYVCCACGFKCTANHFQTHNNTHRPQLFCFRCKEEYPANDMDRHGKEFKCLVCKETFQCLTFLEDHFNVNHPVFSSNCMFCPEPLNQHKKYGLFHCCVCIRNLRRKLNLQIHLLNHTRLKLFKCDLCGKRFSYPPHLTRHSNSCSPSLFKCEICRARFPTRNSLQDHCSEKHSDIK